MTYEQCEQVLLVYFTWSLSVVLVALQEYTFCGIIYTSLDISCMRFMFHFLITGYISEQWAVRLESNPQKQHIEVVQVAANQ